MNEERLGRKIGDSESNSAKFARLPYYNVGVSGAQAVEAVLLKIGEKSSNVGALSARRSSDAATAKRMRRNECGDGAKVFEKSLKPSHFVKTSVFFDKF